MELYVLGPLGFNENKIRNLYKELINLVEIRTERARKINV